MCVGAIDIAGATILSEYYLEALSFVETKGIAGIAASARMAANTAASTPQGSPLQPTYLQPPYHHRTYL